MSLESRFSEEERVLLTVTPSLIGSSMAFAEGSGLGTIKELFANVKTFIGGSKKYPDNEIIVGALPNLEDSKEAMAKAKDMREKMMARLKHNGIDSHKKLKKQLVTDCKAINVLLAEKSNAQETAEYKAWAMSVAENVAIAAKEGGFLGIGGERISVGEKELFAEVAEALGTKSRLT